MYSLGLTAVRKCIYTVPPKTNLFYPVSCLNLRQLLAQCIGWTHRYIYIYTDITPCSLLFIMQNALMRQHWPCFLVVRRGTSISRRLLSDRLYSVMLTPTRCRDSHIKNHMCYIILLPSSISAKDPRTYVVEPNYSVQISHDVASRAHGFVSGPY
jgi:hypothetical protein